MANIVQAVVLSENLLTAQNITEKNPQGVAVLGTCNYGTVGDVFRISSLDDAKSKGITNNPAYSINMFLHNHFAISNAEVVCMNIIDPTDDDFYTQDEQICAVSNKYVKATDFTFYPIKREGGVFTVQDASDNTDITADTIFKMRGTETIFVRDSAVNSVKITCDRVDIASAKTSLMDLEAKIIDNNAIKLCSLILALDFTGDVQILTMMNRICADVRLVTAVSDDLNNAVTAEAIMDELENELQTTIYGKTVALANDTGKAVQIGIATSAKATVYSDIEGYTPIIEGAWLFVSAHSSTVSVQDIKSYVNFSNIVSVGEEIPYKSIYYESGNTNPKLANKLAEKGVNSLCFHEGKYCFISSFNASVKENKQVSCFYQNSIVTNLVMYYTGQLLSKYIDQPILDGTIEDLEFSVENALKDKLSGLVAMQNNTADITFNINQTKYQQNINAGNPSFVPFDASYSPIPRISSISATVSQSRVKLNNYLNNQIAV